jgi:hypothetical protein
VGFRFHRVLGKRPFKVHVSKSGFSGSSGIRGLNVNVPLLSRRRRRNMFTIGIPGTGLSYRHQFGKLRGGDSRWLRILMTVVIIGFLLLWVLARV